MSHNNKKSHPFCVYQKAVRHVFRDLDFTDSDIKKLLRDSYLLNLTPMIRYAHEQHIDPLDYIASIRDILVKSNVAQER